MTRDDVAVGMVEYLPGSACACGAELPWHLLDLVDRHVCNCGRAFAQRDGAVRCVGSADNPFVRSHVPQEC